MRPRQFALKASSYLWASKPAAASYPIGQPVFITDVGGFDGQSYRGSFWFSNGVSWTPVNGRMPLIHTGVPIGFANSGTVSAGAFTPTSTYGASRDTQTGVWLYFPVTAGLPSGAGWYYCTASSGAGPFQVYTSFWNGAGYFVPNKPTSLVAASGGSAFTQISGSDVPAMRFSVPAGLLSANAALHVYALCMYGPLTPGYSIFHASLGASDFGYHADNWTTGSKLLSAICQMAGSTGRLWQPGLGSSNMSGTLYSSASTAGINQTANENVANAIDLTIKLSLSGATSNFEMTNLCVELAP